MRGNTVGTKYVKINRISYECIPDICIIFVNEVVNNPQLNNNDDIWGGRIRIRSRKNKSRKN
jgi:hypothetical protein